MNATGTRSQARGLSSSLLGWIEAGLFVLIIGAVGVVYTIANSYGSHPIAFMLLSMLLAGTILSVLTGASRTGLAIALAPLTWLAGFSTMIVETTFFLMIQWITAAEASLLNRIAIPLSLIAGLVLAGRRPRALAWLGAAIVLAGIGLLIARLDLARQWPGIAGALVASACFVSAGFAGEAHPWNRAARSLSEKLRIAALVTLVTAIGGSLLAGVLMVAVEAGLIAPRPLIPKPLDLVHPPTLWLALLGGGVMFTALNFLCLSSVVRIGTERFMAASAFMPPATYLVLLAAAAFGVVPARPFDWGLMPSMGLAIAGMMVVVAGMRPRS